MRKRWKKLGAICVATAMCAGLLAGCGSSESSSDSGKRQFQSGFRPMQGRMRKYQIRNSGRSNWNHWRKKKIVTLMFRFFLGPITRRNICLE